MNAEHMLTRRQAAVQKACSMPERVLSDVRFSQSFGGFFR